MGTAQHEPDFVFKPEQGQEQGQEQGPARVHAVC